MKKRKRKEVKRGKKEKKEKEGDKKKTKIHQYKHRLVTQTFHIGRFLITGFKTSLLSHTICITFLTLFLSSPHSRPHGKEKVLET